MQRSRPAPPDPRDPAASGNPGSAPPPRSLRWAWWLLAYASLGLALVGIVLPGLPTVPFVLLAAFAAARGSDRLHPAGCSSTGASGR